MMDGQKRGYPFALYLVAGVMTGAAINIGVGLKEVTSEIRKGNTIYLCTESWKLGIFENETCREILKPVKKEQPA